MAMKKPAEPPAFGSQNAPGGGFFGGNRWAPAEEFGEAFRIQSGLLCEFQLVREVHFRPCGGFLK